MMLGVEFLHALSRDMGVNLRRGQVAMPQQLARGSRAVVMGLTEGIVPAMNLHNRDADPRDSDSDPDEAEPEFPAQPGRGGKVGG